MKNLIVLLYALVMVTTGGAILGTAGIPLELAMPLALGIALATSVVNKYIGFVPSFVTLCGELGVDIGRKCDKPVQAGTRERMWLVNFDDWADATIVRNSGDGYTIEDIILASGKSARYIDGINNSIEPSYTMVTVGFNKVFDHQVIAKGFDIDPAIKHDLNTAKDGKYVIITENFYRGDAGETAFEVYGESVGLEFTALMREANNQDTQGAFDFTFSTPVNKEPKMPAPLFITNYATTKALVDGLV